MAEENNLGYDKTDMFSIYEYSKKLIGNTLADVISNDTIQKNIFNGKGGFNQMIEKLFYHYDVNSDPGPDFREAGVELKQTGLKKLLSGEYTIKERLVCDIINYEKVVNETFEESTFYHKCHIMLILFYLYQKGVAKWNLKFLYVLLWKLPEKDLIIIKHDFETIVNKIKAGKAHELSEGDTEYLGACRKGQKGDKLKKQPYSDIGAPQRAFSLKLSYMRTVLDYIKESGKTATTNIAEIAQRDEALVSMSQLRSRSFEDIIKDRFKPYLGLNYLQICEKMGIEPSKAKNRIALICDIIVSGKDPTEKVGNVNRSEEFLKAGITMKTISAYSTGKVKESMSFENINYREVYDNDEWTDSRLYELFSSRFLMVVFRQPKEDAVKEYNIDKTILSDVFFWTMPQSDLNVAEEYWDNIKENVMDGDIHLNAFWKIGDHHLFHVRPKGTKTSYYNAAVNPATNAPCDKYCYWFNAEYTSQIIDNSKKYS